MSQTSQRGWSACWNLPGTNTRVAVAGNGPTSLRPTPSSRLGSPFDRKCFFPVVRKKRAFRPPPPGSTYCTGHKIAVLQRTRATSIRAARTLCPEVQPRVPTAPIRLGNKTCTSFFWWFFFFPKISQSYWTGEFPLANLGPCRISDIPHYPGFLDIEYITWWALGDRKARLLDSTVYQPGLERIAQERHPAWATPSRPFHCCKYPTGDASFHPASHREAQVSEPGVFKRHAWHCMSEEIRPPGLTAPCGIFRPQTFVTLNPEQLLGSRHRQLFVWVRGLVDSTRTRLSTWLQHGLSRT